MTSSPEKYLNEKLSDSTIGEFFHVYRSEWTFKFNSFEWNSLFDKMVILLAIKFFIR